MVVILSSEPCAASEKVKLCKLGDLVSRGLSSCSSIYGKTEYADALAMASLDTLKGRRVAACQRFIINARQHPPLRKVIPSPMYCVNTLFIPAIRDLYLVGVGLLTFDCNKII